MERYFGYNTYSEYLERKMKNAHTQSMEKLWNITKEQHDKIIFDRFVKTGLVQRLAADVMDFIGNCSPRYLGWYFEHPITRAAMPEDILAWADIHHLSKKIFG